MVARRRQCALQEHLHAQPQGRPALPDLLPLRRRLGHSRHRALAEGCACFARDESARQAVVRFARTDDAILGPGTRQCQSVWTD